MRSIDFIVIVIAAVPLMVLTGVIIPFIISEIFNTVPGSITRWLMVGKCYRRNFPRNVPDSGLFDSAKVLYKHRGN